MTSVMKKKRERTKEMILNAAHELITKKGFEETSMESIAARAEISAGTLYNYFGSKSALLIALYARMAKQLHADPPKRSSAAVTYETAMSDLVVVLQHSSRAVSLFSKAITRQIYAFMFVLDPAEIAEMSQVDMDIVAMLMPILNDMKQADWIIQDVSVEQAAMMFYAILAMQNLTFIMSPEMTETQLADAIAAQVETQFTGILPRPN